MKALAVIPARIGSTRLPGKPLADIGGIPMVLRVHAAVAASSSVDHVIVATDSAEVKATVDETGADCILTSREARSGSDRCAEVAEANAGYDIILNVQGDQPFMTTDVMDAVIRPAREQADFDLITAASPLPTSALADPNIVKVVTRLDGLALYFTRAPVPYFREPGPAPVYQHVGIYCYRRDALLRFAALDTSSLERAEQLEQLRALENGFRIFVSNVERAPTEVNTPDDLIAANRILRGGAHR